MSPSIEGQVARHLKNLRAGRLPVHDRERANLAGYFALQYTRTPWFRELANKSVISIQLMVLKDTLERPGELEGILEQCAQWYPKHRKPRGRRRASMRWRPGSAGIPLKR